MLGLFRAALLLSPALAVVIPTQLDGEVAPPNALITLNFSPNQQLPFEQTTLELRIVESTTPCGYGSLTINGDLLAQDETGTGSGSIITDSGNHLHAQWSFTCDQDSIQVMSFEVISVDGQEIKDALFKVAFQQVAPVSVLLVDGAAADYQGSKSPLAIETPSTTLEDEMLELDSMREQLLALEHSIAFKIQYISETYGFQRPETVLHVSDCDSLKCIIEMLYKRAKGMTHRLYGGHHDRLGGGFHRERHGGQHHPDFFHHPNHSLPHPPPFPPPPPHHPPPPSPPPFSKNHPAGSWRQGPERVLNKLHKEVQSSRLGGPGRFLHPPPPRPPHHGPPPHRVGRIMALVVISNVITFGILSLFIRRRRQQRKARWEERRRRLREARDAVCTSGSMAVSNYLSLFRWLADGLSHQNTQDEEKEAILRRLHGSDSDEEDTLSTTMEEEIAQLRAAAGVVSEMVLAEDGRAASSDQPRLTRQRRLSVPSSVASACPTYTTTDESLPAYHEIHRSSDAFVPDGYGYSPGSPLSEPREGSISGSSLDENLGRKD
ncbi:hypothetical protein F5Y16DRAFT_365547 [Xylariaceae sp. FL0255]|nr:hypothetical protein F5Y16DRAFT_365547 [Xylariaceae sp. FL0255]